MCTEFIDTMCTAIERDCPCDGCQNELEAFYDCYITDVSDGDCYYLDCGAYEPTDPPTGPSTPSFPTKAPTILPPADPTGPTVTKTTESDSSSIGPVVGGVVGALAVICGSILGILFLRKRGRTELSNNASTWSGKDPLEMDGHASPPGINHTPTAEPSVSADANPAHQQQQMTPQHLAIKRPAASQLRGTNRSPNTEAHNYMPSYKDQARSVVPPVSMVPAMVEAIPVNDVDTEELTDWTPQRRQAQLDP